MAGLWLASWSSGCAATPSASDTAGDPAGRVSDTPLPADTDAVDAAKVGEVDSPQPDASPEDDAVWTCSTCAVPDLVISDGDTLRVGQNVHLSAAGSTSTCGLAITSWAFLLRAPGAAEPEEQPGGVPYLSLPLHQPGTWELCLRVGTADGKWSCLADCGTVQVLPAP